MHEKAKIERQKNGIGLGRVGGVGREDGCEGRRRGWMGWLGEKIVVEEEEVGGRK